MPSCGNRTAHLPGRPIRVAKACGSRPRTAAARPAPPVPETIRGDADMRDYTKFYIDGEWVAPQQPRTLDVVNPATEAVAGRISLGGQADVDRAVAAARKAFESF